MRLPIVINLLVSLCLCGAYSMLPSAEVSSVLALLCKTGFALGYGLLALAILRHSTIAEARAMSLLMIVYSAEMISYAVKLSGL